MFHYTVTTCWFFFYVISCHGHICHHFCLQDDDDDKHAKEMHPDRVTQTSTWMLIVIVLTHECKFSWPLRAADKIPLLLLWAAKFKTSFFFFFFRSCRHKQSDLRLNVFTLRKECNNVIDRFGYTSLFPITALKLFIFLLGCPVFPDRECYLLQLRGFRLLKSEEKSHHSTL